MMQYTYQMYKYEAAERQAKASKNQAAEEATRHKRGRK